MATTTFTGTTDSHWNDATNWDNGIPSSTKGAVFGASSPACTVDAAADAQTLDCSAYTNTLTLSSYILLYGSATLGSGMILSQGSNIIYFMDSSNGIITSNGKQWGAVEFRNVTFTLADDMDIGGNYRQNGGGGTATLNGNSLYFRKDLVNITNQIVTGSTTIRVAGSTNQSINWYLMQCNVVIESTGGTVTFTGTNYIQASLTYTSGTVNTGTSVLAVNVDASLATDGINWYDLRFHNAGTTTLLSALTYTNLCTVANNVTFSGGYAVTGKTLTINSGKTMNMGGSPLNLSGDFTNSGTFTHGNNTVTFDGTTTFAGATTFNNLTMAAGSTSILTAGQRFSLIGTYTAIGSSANRIIFKTSAGGTTSQFVVATLGSVKYVVANDINSTGGVQVADLGGTLTNTTNWTTLVYNNTYYVVSTTGPATLDSYCDGELIERTTAA